ncbi:MAG: ATP-binding protein [Thermoproteota archaeon]
MIERNLRVSPVRNKAVSIIGHRRAGKTFYFFQIISKLERNRVIYLDFEEPFLKGSSPLEALKVVLEIFPEVSGNRAEYVFLDEVQNANGWESLVRSLLNRGLHVFITGSSSKLLAREVATQLRGRTLSYLLLPFSFNEYLRALRVEADTSSLENTGRIKRYLAEYLENGGFPEIVLEEENERILKDYIDLAFFRDFVERHGVRSISLARLVFNHILQNFSKELSVRAIGRRLRSEGVGFNINTLYDYIEGLEDTLFVFFLRKSSRKVHERELWPRKAYLCDTGVARLLTPLDFWRLMENAVFLELLRRMNEKPFLELYYYKDSQGQEVDFILKERGRIRQLIQVTYASSRDDVDGREIRAIVKASEELGCKNMIIIT